MDNINKDFEDAIRAFSPDDLRIIVRHIQGNFPELIESDSLTKRQKDFEIQMDKAGIKHYAITAASINQLVYCRELVNAERLYYGELEATYLRISLVKEGEYRTRQGEVILAEANRTSVAKGEAMAKKMAKTLKGEYSNAVALHQRVKNYLFYLINKDEILMQKISQLKEEWKLTKHINN